MIREVNLKYSDSKVVFANGNFDQWCVFILKNNTRKAPHDVDYFTFFQDLDVNNDNINVYEDFIQIYSNTNKEIAQATLDIIDQLVCDSGLNGNDKKIYEGYLVVIYLGMIAEENKAFTKLGKRVKRLGMHNLLKEGMTPEEAANISRGKKWWELDQKMQDRGF